MCIPPLNGKAARGEHFHTMVDDVRNPSFFVVTDNQRAFPGVHLQRAAA